MARYTVLEKLGQGGFGVVHRAIQLDLGRPVAIKFLGAAAIGSPEMLERFRREVAACTRLAHPHIVKILDLGEMDGQHYYVMELIDDAQRLDAFIAHRSPVPGTLAARLFDQLLDALEYCHGQGFVHRDVKPANVMIRRGDHLVLMDFGLVRPADRTLLTADGAIIGTALYTPPEAYLGARATPAFDIYAAGIVLYQMLTAKRPFASTRLDDLTREIMTRLPAPVPNVRSDLPGSTDALVGRLVAKDPRHRFGSVAEARVALAAWREAIERPGPQVRPDGTVAPHSRGGAIRLALGVAAVLGGGLWIATLDGTQGPRPDDAPPMGGRPRVVRFTLAPPAVGVNGLSSPRPAVASPPGAWANATGAIERAIEEATRSSASTVMRAQRHQLIRSALGRVRTVYGGAPPGGRRGLWTWRDGRPGLAQALLAIAQAVEGVGLQADEAGELEELVGAMRPAERDNPLYWCVRGRSRLIRARQIEVSSFNRAEGAALQGLVVATALEGFHDLLTGLLWAWDPSRPVADAALAETALLVVEAGRSWQAWEGTSGPHDPWPLLRLFWLHLTLDRLGSSARGVAAGPVERLEALLDAAHRERPRGPSPTASPAGQWPAFDPGPAVMGVRFGADRAPYLSELVAIARDRGRLEKALAAGDVYAIVQRLTSGVGPRMSAEDPPLLLATSIDEWLARLDLLDPDNPALLEVRAGMLRRLGRFEPARMVYLRGIEAWLHARPPGQRRWRGPRFDPASPVGARLLKELIDMLPAEAQLGLDVGRLARVLGDAYPAGGRSSRLRGRAPTRESLLFLVQASLADGLAWLSAAGHPSEPALDDTPCLYHSRARVVRAKYLASSLLPEAARQSVVAADEALARHAGCLSESRRRSLEKVLEEARERLPGPARGRSSR